MLAKLTISREEKYSIFNWHQVFGGNQNGKRGGERDCPKSKERCKREQSDMLFLILPSTKKKITAAMQRHGARASHRAQKISHGGDAQTNRKQKKCARGKQHTLCQDKVILIHRNCCKQEQHTKKKPLRGKTRHRRHQSSTIGWRLPTIIESRNVMIWKSSGMSKCLSSKTNLQIIDIMAEFVEQQQVALTPNQVAKVATVGS
jgi:hypothetical protein